MKPKKSLGQNFFVNKNLAEQIANIVLSEHHDVLVEIGPGQGYFTKIFVEKRENIIAVEKDNELSNDLSIRFPQITVVNEDFLYWDFEQLKNLQDKKILFFGSLPYNTCKKIIKKVISSEYFNTASYFIIQKEVSQKYTNLEPKNNLLAIQTRLYADSKKLFDISGASFNPHPKVTSSLIKFLPSKKDITDTEEFSAFLTECFKHPRKTLSSNLRQKYYVPPQYNELLTKRAQHLSLEQYLQMFSEVKRK
ncbi:MAG TPA: rRNA adenine dimethyltransferase family protein [Candidatus Dojkabacteria bacterium]|nr:rRNA adenine dimethyltransferase family protein [Candidatus Dojkabacteria bacterium]